MASIDENSRIAAASAAAANTVPGPIDVIQNYIPPSWLTDVLQDTFKYATVVKQVFIMQAGVTVKMRRTMDASQRNLDALLQYNAWVDNLLMCYPRAAINKYMKYTTKTMRKAYTGRDVYRKFGDGLEKFQNVFTPTWNKVIEHGISGKTWPEIWQIFVGKLVNADTISAANLSAVEFKQVWLLPYKFLGPPCEKLFPGRKCNENFAEANLQSKRGTDTRKRKSEKLSRKDEREDFARRSKRAIQQANNKRGLTVKDNLLQVSAVMRGVEILGEQRNKEFDMLDRALGRFADDPRAAALKDSMFSLLQSKTSIRDQISAVQNDLFGGAIDLTGGDGSLDDGEIIDPLHVANCNGPIRTTFSAPVEPIVTPPTPAEPVVPATADTVDGQTIDLAARTHQV